MPLPVIANVFRVTADFNRIGGVAPHNVFHVRCTAGDETDVADAIQDAFSDSDTDFMWKVLPSAYILGSVEVLPLDGSSATHVFSVSSMTGQGGSGDHSPATAAVLSLRTAQRGPRGRGRQFIGPCIESQMSDGVIASDQAAFITSAWSAFAGLLAEHSPVVELGVASYAHSDFNVVTSVQCSTIAGTMRRRQDQLR
jgi:hypothetical protein